MPAYTRCQICTYVYRGSNNDGNISTVYLYVGVCTIYIGLRAQSVCSWYIMYNGQYKAMVCTAAS